MAEMDWAGMLAEGDVEALWNGLHRLVSRHPAARPLHFNTDQAAVSSQTEINADITQELFLELFQKQRFDHYVDQGYTSADIENELSRIEIPNLVGERLRRRYPESFRMARRVSALLKTSPKFKRFTRLDETTTAVKKSAGHSSRKTPPRPALEEAASADDYIEALVEADPDDDDATDDTPLPKKPAEPQRQRMVNQLFGLKEWPSNKARKDPGSFGELAGNVHVRIRDIRYVGRSGTSQLIISNPELESLLVEILNTIDSPADVRTIRQIALSKIPLQDYRLASLDEPLRTADDGTRGATLLNTLATEGQETPESQMLLDERHREVAELADQFLNLLKRAVNNNERRYARLVKTIYYFYFDPHERSQLELAELLGVSDSLVSDNRKIVEYELKKLQLSVEEGQVFSEALRKSLLRDHSELIA